MMHVYLGPGPWPWIVVGVVLFLVLRRRRHRRRWGLGRMEEWVDRAGRHGRSGRRGGEAPWWRDAPASGAGGDAQGRDSAAAGEGDGGGGREPSRRLLTEQTLESLQRDYVEGRLGVEEYEQALDTLYAKRRGR